MKGAVLYTALILTLVLAVGVATANPLSKDAIKIDPEQSKVCEFMRKMAYDIQHERRLKDLEAFPPTDSDTMNEVAKWVYREFTKLVTPDEVGHGMNSDCVGHFQFANKDRLKVSR